MGKGASGLSPKELNARIAAALSGMHKVVIGLVQSGSNKKLKHRIRIGADHAIYCSCEGWLFSKKRPKTCTHLEKYKREVIPQEIN